MKAKPKDSCKEMFGKMGILTLYSQYIFSILMFVVKHKDLFTINMELHKINTYLPKIRHSHSFSEFKKEYFILVLHYLTLYPPISSKLHMTLINLNKLRKFLIVNSFYSVDEYFDWNNKSDFGVSQKL
jgi:hypothetical protein